MVFAILGILAIGMAVVAAATKAVAASEHEPISGLTIEAPCGVGDVADILAAHNTNANIWQAEVEALFAERAKLLADAPQLKLVDFFSHLEEINTARMNLEYERESLAWNRYELLWKLKPFYAAHLAAMKAAYEQQVDNIVCSLRANGINEMAMPAGSTCSETAGIQLRNKAKEDWLSLAAMGAVRSAEDALQGIEAQLPSVPLRERCAITWSSPAGGTHPGIVRLLGLEAGRRPERAPDSVYVTRIKAQLGFEYAPTLPEHDAIFTQILSVSPNEAFTNPLNRVKADSLATVRKLVQQLPPTVPSQRWLADTSPAPAVA